MENCDGHTSSTPSNLEARHKLYQRYAESYHERFRAAIDYQFAEEPRQVIGMAILLVGCIVVGMISDRREDDAKKGDYGQSAFWALSTVAFGALVYCFLQVRLT